jgi:hypothetical protein
MADEVGQFTVSNLVVRPTPVIGPGGAVWRQVTVSFNVGTHGPFTLVYPGPTVDYARISGDIRAQVEQLRVLAQSVAALNGP